MLIFTYGLVISFGYFKRIVLETLDVIFFFFLLLLYLRFLCSNMQYLEIS